MSEAIPLGFVLDWPASLNRAIGGGVKNALHVNREKRTYKHAAYYAVRAQLAYLGQVLKPFPPGEPVAAYISLFPPDARIRDIDNGLKWILDAIEYSGAVENDRQIELLEVRWNEAKPPHGAVCVVLDYADVRDDILRPTVNKLLLAASQVGKGEKHASVSR